VGGRYTTERKESGNYFSPASGIPLDNLDDPEHKTWSKFTPKISVAWQTTDDVLTYLTYSTGFRSGGFNGRPGTVDAALLPYDPETVSSWEAGFKSTWLNNTLQFNAAAFHTIYKDKQEELNRPAASTSGQETVVVNVSDAIIDGAEVELAARPLDGLTLRANAGYLDARYDKFDYDLTGTGLPPTDNSNLRLRRAPKWTTTLAGTYEWDMFAGKMSASSSYHFISDYSTAFNDSPQTRDSAQRILDASLNYEINNTRFTLYGSNLLNDHEWQHAFDVAGLFTFAAPRAPRTYGVEVTYTFGK
jgi:iron complex outermembrane receptor protein